VTRYWIIAAVALLWPATVHASNFYVSPAGDDAAAGSLDAPWRSIQKAAGALHPGDTAVLMAGTYREDVTLTRGGTTDAPVTITAMPGARVIISGADLLADGWTKADGIDGAAYAHAFDHVFAINHTRDGRPILTHPADTRHELIGRAEQVIHDGRLLRQVLRKEHLAPGTFFHDIDGKRLYVWLEDNAQTGKKNEVEASARSTWLTSGASFVHLRGITFRYAANFAQRGALALQRPKEGGEGPRGWLVEDCVFERANGPGASLSGSNHLFRRCTFQDNGQLGFGASHCNDTRMEECGLYRNNAKGFATGWEAGGVKVTLSRGFVFDRCRAADNRGIGIWYDIGNENSEVKNCYVADNDEAGIFYEISYGLRAHDNLIVNNANRGEKPYSAWGNAGITLSSSQDCIVENNTLVANRDGIALREQNRSTPRIDGTKSVRVFNKNHLIRNNVVAASQAFNIAFWMDTNFFGGKSDASDAAKPTSEDPATLNIRLENNLLWPLPAHKNYLYGATWRPKSRQFDTPAEFSRDSGIIDSSRMADPMFVDALAGDFRFEPASPALATKSGVAEKADVPQRAPPRP